MKYVSTRGKSTPCSSAEAIKKGLAEDGGLYFPDEFPTLTSDDIERLARQDYPVRAADIMHRFLSDSYTYEELLSDCREAYSEKSFPGGAAPIARLSGNLRVLELWHGPTAAFKDMALQIMPRLFVRAIKKTGDSRTAHILVATSGDTGKAALEGYRDVDGVKISVFYPVHGVSRVQKLQMATQEGNNVKVYSVIGNFDDAQNGVKRIFGDAEIRRALDEKGEFLSSANSINWGRLVPQVVYYVSAYCDLVKSGDIKNGEMINVCVPTGNFGNILAAYIARNMGLPIAKFVCASNSNNVLTDFFATGTYDRNRAFHTTTSPSMDILISSNLERLLYLLTGEDDAQIREWFGKLATEGKYEVTDEIKKVLSEEFFGGYCDDEQTKATIHEIYTKYSYTCDTHTAVAVKVYQDYVKATGDDDTRTIIASTASPYKFSASVLEAIDGVKPEIDEYDMVDELNKKSGMPIPQSLALLKNKERRFTGSVEKTEMKDFVLKQLGIIK